MHLFLTNTQLFTSLDIRWWITCGLLWCFYQLFGLSFWRHPFTAEDPWVSKWCNATFLQIWWWNKLVYTLNGLMGSSFQQMYIFGWTAPLRQLECADVSWMCHAASRCYFSQRIFFPVPVDQWLEHCISS